jgi:transposase-like protein
MPDINIPDFDLNKELSKCRSMEDLVGKNGLMQRLFGNIIQQFLEVEVDVPRDRKAEFEPKIVKKYETVCNELDKKIIGLYAKGMPVDEIVAEIDDLKPLLIKILFNGLRI